MSHPHDEPNPPAGGGPQAPSADSTTDTAQDDKAERRLRKAEERLARVERSLADTSSELAKAQALLKEHEQENAELRQTQNRLRDLLAAERAKAMGCVGPQPATAHPEPTPRPKSAPAVEPPRRGRAQQQTHDVRVGVFIDVANLAGAARRLHGGAVDFRKLLATVLGGRRLVEARAYAIDKGGGFDGFAKALRAAGYRVCAKKPKVFPDGQVKADWDIGICVDALTLATKVDVVVLGSGDGDFTPLVMALKRLGLQVEAASFAERSADVLLRAVDRVITLDEGQLGG
jgi:uncharacterized LabA/DUF88 family protein